MNFRKSFIPFLLISTILFVGLGVLNTGRKHYLQVQENVILDQEVEKIKNENCGLKKENLELKAQLKSIKEKIKEVDSSSGGR